MSSTELVNYDAMCHAIDLAHSVDEAKEIRDKSFALEVYARQAANVDAESKCAEIRVRAERRTGELLKETAATGQRERRGGDRRSKSRQPTLKLADYGLTNDQSSQFQRLADVPKDLFELELAKPNAPSAATIIAAADPAKPATQPKFTSASLWLHGTLRDFKEQGWLERDPIEVMDEHMTDGMRQEIRRLAPEVAAWLTEITEAANV
jgi:hypothetical protein